MPTREWSHLCNYFLIERNGAPSIIGIFENIRAAKCPAAHPMFFVVSSWQGVPGETFKHRIAIRGPQSEIASTKEVMVYCGANPNISGKTAKAITVNNFPGIRLPEFGEYCVDILVNDMVIHTLPFTVTPTPQKPPTENKQAPPNSLLPEPNDQS